MRIPTYVSEGNLDSPRLQTARIAEPIDLSSTIRAVEQQAGYALEKQAQEWKTYTIAETQSAQLEIDTKYNELMERVKNGGSYATVEKEFEKFYKKRVGQSLQNLSQDPNTARLAQLDYNKQGVEYGMRLKNAISTRRKSDAIQAVNSRVEGWKREYIESTTPEAKMNVIQKFNSAISGLEGSGAISKGSGENKVKAFLADVKGMELSLIEANQGHLAASEFLEKNKEVFPVEAYVRQKIEYGKIAKAEAMQRMFEESVARDYSQEDVDEFEEVTAQQEAEEKISPEEFEQRLTYSIAQSGKVPKQMQRTMSGMMSVLPDTLTPERANEIARSARIITNSVAMEPALANGTQEGFGDSERITANMITKQINEGVDAYSAVKSVMMKRNDPNFSKLYKDARGDFLKNKKYPKYVDKIKDKLDLDDGSLSFVMTDIIDSFAESKMLGASDKDALNAAIEKAQGKTGKFNGQVVDYPPHKVTAYKDEQIWVDAANKALTKVMPEGDPLLGKVQPVLMGDARTVKALNSGLPSNQVPFVLYIKDENGGSYPMTNPETGNLIYVTADPKQKLSAKQSFVNEYESFVKDYKSFVENYESQMGEVTPEMKKNIQNMDRQMKLLSKQK